MKEEREGLFNKLLNLEKRLTDVQNMKKSAAADYRDQIKDIKGEIRDIVQTLGDNT